MISESTKVYLEIARLLVDKAIDRHKLANPSFIDIKYAILPEQELHNTEHLLLKATLQNIDSLLDTHPKV